MIFEKSARAWQEQPHSSMLNEARWDMFQLSPAPCSVGANGGAPPPFRVRWSWLFEQAVKSLAEGKPGQPPVGTARDAVLFRLFSAAQRWLMCHNSDTLGFDDLTCRHLTFGDDPAQARTKDELSRRHQLAERFATGAADRHVASATAAGVDSLLPSETEVLAAAA